MVRIATSALEKLCQRASTGLQAGLDVRSLFERETKRGSPTHQRMMRRVLKDIEEGEALSTATRSLDGYIPSLAVEMIQVGEESGRLGEAFAKLADHYANIRQLWRNFLSMIWWPLIELVGAIVIIGLLILVLGVIGEATNTEAIDIFGLGFSWQGNLGLYVTVVTLGLVTIGVGVGGLIRGWFGPGPLAIAMRIPVLGSTLKHLALSRFAWAFGMAIDAGMDALSSMKLGLRSTQNAFFQSHEADILRRLDQGQEFHEAMRTTEAFSDDFLETLETAEMTGTVTESLDRLSVEYQEKASTMFRALTVIGGVAVMILVGGVIIVCAITLIMKLYIGPLYDALEGDF